MAAHWNRGDIERGERLPLEAGVAKRGEERRVEERRGE